MRRPRTGAANSRPLTHTGERRVTTLTRKVGKDDGWVGALRTPPIPSPMIRKPTPRPRPNTMRRIAIGMELIEAHNLRAADAGGDRARERRVAVALPSRPRAGGVALRARADARLRALRRAVGSDHR